ncbi:hypothetical protein ZYGM_000172 [Zygosaccharomyces mellis]|uniref:NAD-dependent epimerase/dehydratase domain-containing protein n=1 Tax=Zygosaccharomyces mellis TaxID=42258 RepID=A0A4C2E6K9_9SACH|nr:hypothetical protein ZYGM_000172 [Zygosaccharomyces mellis]
MKVPYNWHSNKIQDASRENIRRHLQCYSARFAEIHSFLYERILLKEMKVFVTGASGFIGSALVSELSNAGHHVVGLARSEESAKKIKSLGTNVEVLRGDLEDLDALRKGAREAEGIAHLGFIHDFQNFEKCCEIDRTATEAMLESIIGTNKPFVYTSGTLSLPDGKISDETVQNYEHSKFFRDHTEKLALSYGNKGVRATTVRFPPSVHGKGDKAFIPWIISVAEKSGKSGYVGDGQNVWPAVARPDAAHLFRLVLEKGRAGRVYHSIAEQGVKSKEIAKAIGDSLHVPTASIASEDAMRHFGFLGAFFSKDNPVSSEITRKELGWNPQGLGLIEDIKKNYIF